MSEGTIEQSGHSEEALYNILSAALSKHGEVKQVAEKVAFLTAQPWCAKTHLFPYDVLTSLKGSTYLSVRLSLSAILFFDFSN
jgi:hypothetical protein